MSLATLALLLPASLTAASPGQPIAPPAPSPVLFVKLTGPTGSRATFYPSVAAQSFRTPVVFGLRPGYSYRVLLNELKPGSYAELFPSFEVVGVLRSATGLKLVDHPVPVTITAEEVERVLNGGFITKYYYLEREATARPIPSQPDEALEFPQPNESAAWKEAVANGRPLLIFRLGGKQLSIDEQHTANVPGTILLPGESVLPPPSMPPCFPFCTAETGQPFLDGFRNEECIHDGGDERIRLGISGQGRLFGLDPSDTAIEFSKRDRKRVETSNKVCLCVPRYISLRVEAAPGGVQLGTPLNTSRSTTFGQFAASQTPGASLFRIEILKRHEVRLKPAEQLGRDAPVAVERLSAPIGVGSIAGNLTVAKLIPNAELTAYPGCSDMLLAKDVDPPPPYKIGQIVTFTLRYRNPGAEPIRDVAISDSLSARLEYIDGSAKADRAMSFTITPNEAGSSILRWELEGELKPGQAGKVTFQARIR